MYSIKVASRSKSYATAAAGTAAAGGSGSASGSRQPSPSASGAVTPTRPVAAGAEGEALLDHVAFSAGNPRVEHLVGRVHLYRHLPPDPLPPAAADAKQKQAAAGSLSSEIEPAPASAGEEAGGSGEPQDLPVSRARHLLHSSCAC